MNGQVPDRGNYCNTCSILLILFLVIAIFLTGCVRSNTGYTIRPEAFESPPEVIADLNTQEISLPLNESMLVRYPWTPEDGRYWRVSVTSGLFVAGDRYIPHPPDIPVVESGTREWMVKVISPGKQSFVATLRPRANAWNQEIIQNTITVFVTEHNGQGET
ncbi:MAG: protease inhibitor I42 family protein [Methanomicrobiales archaeon]|nr:protease inhibitor I42 family protein [Methanomicrobiales archaeon]